MCPTCLTCKFLTFLTSMWPSEPCGLASTSWEGSNVFLTLKNVTVNCFSFWLHNSAVYYFFFFLNQLLLHEATNLAAFLSFPQLCHPALPRAVSHTEWWISSPFSRSFSFSEHCWHVNTELTANATNSRVNKAYLIHIFLHKVHHSFFALRDTKQHFRTRLHLEAILNMESPKKSTKGKKIWHLINW